MAVEKAQKKKSLQKTKAGGGERQLKITLVRSVISRPQRQREIVKGLGLRKVDSSAVRRDCPEIRGMIRKVIHLVKVEEIDPK